MLSNVFPKLIDIHYSLKLVLIEVAKLFYSIIYHILPNKSLMWKKRAHWNSISFYCLGTLCSIWGLSQREDTSRLSWNRFQGVPCQLYSGNFPPPLRFQGFPCLPYSGNVPPPRFQRVPCLPYSGNIPPPLRFQWVPCHPDLCNIPPPRS